MRTPADWHREYNKERSPHLRLIDLIAQVQSDASRSAARSERERCLAVCVNRTAGCAEASEYDRQHGENRTATYWNERAIEAALIAKRIAALPDALGAEWNPEADNAVDPA